LEFDFLLESVSAIVVTYNPQVEVLAEELAVLRAQVEHLIIVDNASTNQALEALQKILQSEDVLIVNPENMGIAAALNQGAAKAMSLESCYLILMDHDSIPCKGFVDVLKSEFQSLSKEHKIAAVGPVIVDSKTLYEFPAVRYTGVWRNHIFVEPNCTVFCDHLISSGTFMSLQSYKDIGAFDESLFIDFVDIEWGLRAKSRGYVCAQTNKVQLKHQLGVRMGKFWFGKFFRYSIHKPERMYYIARNPWLMLRNAELPICFRLHEVFYSLIRLLMLVILSDQKVASLVSYLKGTIDGLIGRNFSR
jgi:rhamnosyltransferase